MTATGRLISIICILLASVLLLTGCGETALVTSDVHSIPEVSSTPPPKTPEELRKERVDEMLKGMTLEQKVGQLFIVTPEALCSSKRAVTEFSQQIIDNLEKYSPSGIILFGANILSPSQLHSLTECFKNAASIPLFISIDEEGGRVARIGNNKNFDVKTYSSMLQIGKSEDFSKAFEVGETIGEYLNEYSFNLNFAPVADVFSNPKNTVIGNRSFGDDPQTVSKMVNSAIDGFHSKNIMTCIKHFPGHGDTAGDTHTGYVAINKSWEQLKECELIPFINALSKTDMIMAAHITAKNITNDSLPCSLSYEILTNKLRNELKYEGVIITDSLQMGAIKKAYSSADASVSAFNAGADILLMPENFEESYFAVLQAVKSGEISTKRLDKSVSRILTLKDKYLMK